MQYSITNMTRMPLLLRLLTGRTIHLGAGASTGGLDGSEIHGNPRITRLVERRMAVVEGTEQAAGEDRKGRSRRSTPRRESTEESGTDSPTQPAEGTTTTSTGGSR